MGWMVGGSFYAGREEDWKALVLESKSCFQKQDKRVVCAASGDRIFDLSAQPIMKGRVASGGSASFFCSALICCGLSR